MSKPREFWIINEYPYSTWVSDKPLNSADTQDEIHVIEKSAYDAAVAERDELRETLKHDVDKIEAAYKEERDAALALLREARETLDKAAADKWETVSQSTGIAYRGSTDLADLAKRTLTLIDESGVLGDANG